MSHSDSEGPTRVPCGGHRGLLDFCWGLGNEMLLFASPGARPRLGVHADQSCSFVHTYRWDCFLGETRKLITESFAVFSLIQRHTRVPVEKKPGLSQWLRFSRNYRAIIRAHTQQLSELAHREAVSLEGRKNEVVQEMKLLGMAEMLWHMFEIFFLDSGQPIVPQIVDWYSWHFVDDVVEATMRLESPSEDPHYWEVVYKLAMHGRLQGVIEMLSSHPEAGMHDSLTRRTRGASGRRSDNPFALAITLLESMPRPHAQTNEAGRDFAQWQTECRALARSDVRTRQQAVSGHAELQVLGRVLIGDAETLVSLTSSWYELMVAELLFRCPNTISQDLKYCAEECIRRTQGLASVSDLDHVLLALMDFDAPKALRLIGGVGAHWWLAAHLADLLHHSGALKSNSLNVGSDMREFYLLRYAMSLLASQPALWQTTVGYLRCCPRIGRGYAEAVITRQSPRTTQSAAKVLHACCQFQPPLLEEARTLCRVMGATSMRNGLLPSAVSWFLRARDHKHVLHIADALVDDALSRGTHEALNAVADSLAEAERNGAVSGDRVGASAGVAFVRTYRDMQVALATNRRGEAAALTLSLMGDGPGSAPRKFVPSLLTEALPLLEGGDVVFGVEDTYTLIAGLERITMSHCSKELLQGISADELGALRLALARNLARAVVATGVGPSP